MNEAAVRKFIDGLWPAFEAGDRAVGGKHAEAANVRRVQDQFRALSQGNAAAFLDALAEDVEFEILGPAAVPFVGRWKGRQPVADAVARNLACLEDQRPEVTAVVAQGDTVVVSVRERGRYRPTGREYDLWAVQFYTFRDGKVVRFRQLFDGAALLAAVGPAQAAPAGVAPPRT
ncbi:MAG: nuclear transport factor 2 family protein [Gemmataceae bacterium]